MCHSVDIEQIFWFSRTPNELATAAENPITSHTSRVMRNLHWTQQTPRRRCRPVHLSMPGIAEQAREQCTTMASRHAVLNLPSLWGALIYNASAALLRRLLRGSAKAMSAISSIVSLRKKIFKKSLQNSVHSIIMVYAGSITSKAQYRALYRSPCRQFCQQQRKRKAVSIPRGIRVDQLLSYDRSQTGQEFLSVFDGYCSCRDACCRTCS